MLALPLLLLASLLPLAQAEVRRFGVMVGNGEGSPGMPLLYFAESDAEKLAGVLTSVGGYRAGDVKLILGGNRSEVLRAMVAVRSEIARARAEGDETLFVFFYAGHADHEQLKLGRSWLGYQELDKLLELTGADVRLAFLDACNSGSITRARGGTLKPGFISDISERLGTEGQVVITSSSSDETSQESSEIGGGFFTHFLVSGLLGAADENGDDRVSLAETYRYVYQETVFRTSSTRAGTQHPTYEWDLAGKGDVVLSDLSSARSSLVFSPSLHGPVTVFDLDRRMFVAELDLGGEGAELSLREGDYLVQRRYPSHLEVARLRVPEGSSAEVEEHHFQAMAYNEDLARGIIDEHIRRMELPRLSLRIMAGQRGFSEGEVTSSYIPRSPTGGAALRFNWRDGKWISADVLSGALATNLTFDGLDYSVPILSTSTTAGVGAGFATRPRLFQTGIGARIAAAWFRRDFLDGSTAPQDLFTFSPGLMIFAGIHPGRFELDIEYHVQVLPYQLDEDLNNLVFGESLLVAGYRF